jgi:hypothetical protein
MVMRRTPNQFEGRGNVWRGISGMPVAFLALVAIGLLTLMGCSGSLVEEPEWNDLIVLAPGAFGLERNDSTFIGFGFWLCESDGDFLGCVPGCIERIEVYSPCWDRYRIEPNELAWTYSCSIWEEVPQVTYSKQQQYWHLERVDSLCDGFYTWEIEIKSDKVLVAEDFLSVSSHDFTEADFSPSDSVNLAGNSVRFSINPDLAIGAWELSLRDESGELKLAGDWVRIEAESTFVVDWLDDLTWYSWKIRVWDHGECNLWEMPERRWFKTGG